MKLTGIGSTPLADTGTAYWCRPADELTLPDRPDPGAVDSDSEQQRYESAKATARAAIEQARQQTADRVGETEAAVFEAHLKFLDDPQLVGDIEAAISEGTPAEHAVNDRFSEAVAQFEGMDGKMAERADDLRDIRDRLLAVLLNVDPVDLSDVPPGTVLLAERLTPSETVTVDPDAVAGIATVTGGRTGHAAIIARSLSIPAVVGVGSELRQIDAGAELLVDGSSGVVAVDPDEKQQTAATEIEAPTLQRGVATTDGTEITVAANIGSKTELDPAVSQGADGIGLFRTEFLFLDRETPPDEREQYEAITAALEAFPEGRIVVRTPDLGGDKAVPYLDLPVEPNPFLGKRGIRLSVGDHAPLFETQLRALLRAAASEAGDLAVMFPMVTQIEEVETALDHVERVASELESEGYEYAIPELGAMIETPAAAAIADALADRLDFLSIGTNDLTQYVMAVDRENDTVADYHDPLQPAVLRTINRATAAADDAWIGMCGEMAGDPALTELLLGLGVDELSMSAVTVPAVKEQVEQTEMAAAREFAERVVACETRAAVAELLEQR